MVNIKYISELGSRVNSQLASGSVEHKEIINQINTITSSLKENGISREDISDGTHSFKDLYYHRLILFSFICNTYPDISWKSIKHYDGSIWEGFFIIGITTPEGEFTYHFKEEHYGMFNVVELETAPEYDGHTSKDVVRLLSLLNKN